MPSKNRVKDYVPFNYYHIYNRGVNKQNIFEDDEDYTVFLNLLKRYLGDLPEKDPQGREYPWLSGQLELLAFCLMPNHFHLLIYQDENEKAMTQLMRGVLTSYTAFFNKKYKRVGHLFQDAYKASLIDDQTYLEHISRYIHLNPYEWENYEWSSLPYYLGSKQAAWVKPDKILDIFEGESYNDFVADYEDYKRELKALKNIMPDF